MNKNRPAMRFLTIIGFTVLIMNFGYCQKKPIKIIFQTIQKDTATERNETKKYILKKHAENSDFNYTKLNDIDSNTNDTLGVKNLMPVFEPVSGRYTYYQFIATFVGEAYNVDGPPLFQDFHDILIVKTDHENKILDAFQYTLEWAEPPHQYDLFRSSAKNITLTNNLDISKLKFKRTYSWSDDNEEMDENGMMILE